MPVENWTSNQLDELVAFRRDLHENPELLYDVNRTAEKVAEALRAAGVDEVVTGIGRTGVVGVIRGQSNRSGRAIGLRADMDALPILEETGAEWSSKVPGKMHACGHDGHTTMLLGAARELAQSRAFDGTVIVIFQPAEEGGAGAKAMIDDGLFSAGRSTKSMACIIDPTSRSVISPSIPARSWGRSMFSTSPLRALADMRPHHTRPSIPFR